MKVFGSHDMENLLGRYVPSAALAHCLDLWRQYPFALVIARSRSSRQGDYLFDRRKGMHRISVNGDLDPYSFLITYLHEVAHRIVNAQRGLSRARPHGTEWQEAFRSAMAPVMSADVFPEEILTALRRHMLRPKASTYADPVLVQAIWLYNSVGEGLVYLSNLSADEVFVFRGQQFQKIHHRRTRVLCRHLASGRRYMIAGVALVQKVA